MEKPIDYYENSDLKGAYQYVPLSKIIDDILYDATDDDSIFKNIRRTKIIKHAKDALLELNKNTFNEDKGYEITVPENLYVSLPHDFVGLKAIFVVVHDELTNSNRLKKLNRNNNIHTRAAALQDYQGEILFDNEGRVLKSNNQNTYNKPYKKYEFVKGGDNKQVAIYGEYVVDKNKGVIAFNSELYDKDIVIIYRTDGLQYSKFGEDEIKVHKDMINVTKALIRFTLIETRQSTTNSLHQRFLNRYKTEEHKARLNNLNFSLTEISRKARTAKS